MTRWPNVPAVFGWLSLNRRGVWKLKGEAIPNRAVIEFIARNYASDSRGRWFFQNGPQRVFVDLDYTPWVFALDGRGNLVTHTGRDCGVVSGAWLDEAGTLILLGEPGPGIVDDRDLMTLSDRLVDTRGRPVDDECIARFIASPPDSDSAFDLEHRSHRIPVRRIDAREVPERLKFDAHPAEHGTGAR